MVGRTVSHYRVLEKLGEGGMGVVYKAEDTRLGRAVALKFLPERLASDRVALERFQREARAASALNHPHICTIYDIDEAPSPGSGVAAPFIAMELLEGEPLRARIARAALSVPTIVDIAVQLADALESAHGKGIVHRDIKPDNIFITTRTAAKLLDFGIAKLVSEAPMRAAVTMTRVATGRVALGTIAYMSPEQVRGEQLDARTDLFSLGVVLYEMATGTQPFRGTTSGAVLGEILTKAPTAPVRLNADIPPELERIVNKLLEKERDVRYQSARDLRVDLERLRRTLAPGAEAALVLPPPPLSLVVLPFDNISPDVENEYFADGLTEEVISDLSQVKALRVISRTSAMRFKRTEKDIRAIASELGVRYVLEGSVRKAGNNVRITAQLIEAARDAHIWANKYGGTLDNIFGMQEEVSRAIVAALKVQLAPDEDRRIADRRLTNAQAYDAYLRARQDMWRWTEPALDRARLQMENALELAGDNALLYAGLGSVYIHYAHGGLRMTEETYEYAERFARKALELEPNLAEGHSLMASIAMARGRMKQAFRHAQHAIEINPSDAEALLGVLLPAFPLGKIDGVRDVADRLAAIDPLSYLTPLTLSFPAWTRGRYDIVLEHCRTAHRLDPESFLARWWLVQFLGANGLFEDAETHSAAMMRDAPGHVMPLVNAFLLHALRGRRAEALEMVSDDWAVSAWRDYWLPYTMAQAYALLDESGEALRWLEHAVDKGWMNYPYIAEVDPWLRHLRDKPQFAVLMQRVKREWEEFEV